MKPVKLLTVMAIFAFCAFLLADAAFAAPKVVRRDRILVVGPVAYHSREESTGKRRMDRDPPGEVVNALYMPSEGPVYSFGAPGSSGT